MIKKKFFFLIKSTAIREKLKKTQKKKIKNKKKTKTNKRQ